MVLYVLGTWTENEHCVTVDLSLVDSDDDGRLRSQRGLLLRRLHFVLSSPPNSQNSAPQGAQSGELDQRHRPSVFDLSVSGRPPAASEGVGPP